MSKHLEQIKKNKDVKINPFAQKGGGFKESQINPELAIEVPDSLEEIEDQITKLDTRIWESAWLIGKRLIAVRDMYLKDLGFINISEYSKEKFGFSHATTVRFIFLASTFDISTARNFGSKLRLLQPLNDSEREKYLDWIKENNPSFREIEDKIKSENKKPNRSQKKIDINKTKITVNLKEMGLKIEEKKQDEFLNRLTMLIEEFSS
ncbi:MAG: hypothetical protein OEZ36_06045 [Spirochaetota bacterium]|nr:hypothetical protein [Spirochaetota bacterium]